MQKFCITLLFIVLDNKNTNEVIKMMQKYEEYKEEAEDGTNLSHKKRLEYDKEEESEGKTITDYSLYKKSRIKIIMALLFMYFIFYLIGFIQGRLI